MSWTAEMQSQLLRLHRAGLTYRAIAAQMNLKHEQVYRKCHRLGVTRDNPGQPNTKLAAIRHARRREREWMPKEDVSKAKRLCLRCKEMFWSEWAGNRVCRHCKSGEIWRALC